MNIDLKQSFLVAILFLFIIFILVLIRIRFTPDERFPIFLGSAFQPLPSFKTGDCVFVSYRSIRGKLVKVFTGSMWSHMGMIYKRQDGATFVIEACYYDQSKHGVLQTPLLEWLCYNKKRTLAWLPKLGPPISDSEVNRVFSLVKDGEMDTFVVNWLKAVVNRKYYPEPGKSEFYCSELIATLFQELGVLRKELMPSSYSPRSFMLRRVPVQDGHAFDEPQLFFVPQDLCPGKETH